MRNGSCSFVALLLTASTGATTTAAQDGPKKPQETPRSPTQSAGSANPRPITPGENAVYRIDADGVAREILRAKAMMFALAILDDSVFVGIK